MTKCCPEIQRRGSNRYGEVKQRAKRGGREPLTKGLFAQQSGCDHLEAVRHGAAEDGRRGHKICCACQHAGGNSYQHYPS